jgi:hypothetical protein
VTSATEDAWPSSTAGATALDHGLKLLELQAEAAKPAAEPGGRAWVNRRVEQLEFLDTRAVRWRSSVDFVVPADAPTVHLGGKNLRLIPVSTLPKGNLVAFDLRDEQTTAMWLPTLAETTDLMAPAIIWLASVVLERETLPRGLDEDLATIVSARPHEHRQAYRPFAAAAAAVDFHQRRDEARTIWEGRPRWPGLGHLLEWYGERRTWRRGWNRAANKLYFARKYLENTWRMDQRPCPRCPDNDLAPRYQPLTVEHEQCLRCAAYKLMSNYQFRSQLEELAENFLIYVAVASAPETRRIVKWSSEQEISFWSRKGLWWRLWQGLGMQCWQLGVKIGGRGGSHHLEVAAPPGVDIVQIVTKPVAPELAIEPGPQVSPGLSPHVHARVPAGPESRCTATIFVRTSRGGWLTASWSVTFVIAVVMFFGKRDLSALFPHGVVSAEAGTAATLLLALLGVIATWLVRPSEHPLASRLLTAVRLWLLVDVGAVLVGIGDLVLHRSKGPPEDIWLALSVVAYSVLGLMSLARLLPVAPQRWGMWRRNGGE